MPYKKMVKKVVLRKKRNVKRKSSYASLSKRVSQLARNLKPEKKTFLQNNNAAATQTLGQLFGDVAGGGYAALIVSPNPAQGTGGLNGRIGNEIKMTSAYYQFQFTQQSATVSPIRVKLYWFHIKAHPQSTNPAGYATVLFNPNPFTNGTLYDYNSSIDSNYIQNTKLLMKKTILIRPDNYSGQLMTKSFNFGLKLKKPIPIRFSGDGSQVQTEGYIYLYMMCDNGNCSTTTASTFSNCPNTAINTGLTYNYNFLTYFTDV